MERFKSQDFWSGVTFVAFGVVVMLLSTEYPMGTAARMGPGYFPRLLGAILTMIGVVLLVLAFARGGGRAVEPLHLGLMARLLLSLLVFGLALQPLGLVITSFLAVAIAAWAGPEFKLREGLLLGLILGISSALVFVVALKQTIPLWPSATTLARLGL